MAKPRRIMGASVPLSGHDVPWYGAADSAIAKDQAQETTAEVPVWVNGLQRWVTGIDRRTTCDDVIKALLGSDPCKRQHSGWSEGQGPPDGLHHRYAIVERWRKVERPLDGRSRILKVWSAWGDAQRDVKLALRRRVAGAASGGSGTLSRDAARRRRHHHHLGRELSAKTLHPKRFQSRGDEDERYHYEKETEPWAEDSESYEHAGADTKFTETMEKLMKLILAQGETIQTQLKKLREREDQIDRFEHEVHRLRVKNHGSNYLLDTYLKGVDAEEGEEEEGAEGEGSKGEDSGVVTEGGSGDGNGDSPFGNQMARVARKSDRGGADAVSSHRNGKEDFAVGLASDPDETSRSSEEISLQSTSPKDIQAHIELWEKILKVNKKLEKTEECLVKLHVKLKQHSREKSPCRNAKKASGEEEERLRKELEWTRLELEKVAVHSSSVDGELKKNEEALAHADEWLEVRRRVLEGLQLELDVTERESEALSKKKEELTAHPRMSGRFGHQAPAPNSTGGSPQRRPLRDDVVEKAVGVMVTPTAAAPIKKLMEKDAQDTDSNSDTGLSSLHSSSEEGGYVLDTLV